MEDKINFFIPVEVEELEKAGDKNDTNRYKNMYVQGVASTPDVDLDGEVLEPSGFDLSVLKTLGTINYEHLSKQSPRFIIGEPVDAYIKDNKLFIKGKLWEKSAVARDLYDTLHIMKASGSKRKLAWSIEGKPILRDPHNPKRVMKAMLTNIALTFMPKNGNTFADLVKGTQKADYIKPEYDLEEAVPYLYKGMFGNSEYILNKDFTITRRPVSEEELNIRRAFEAGLISEDVFQKAMSATNETGQQLVNKDTHGAALKGESLDKDLKILTIPINTAYWIADNWKNFKKDTRRAIQKALHNQIMKARSGVYEDTSKNRKLGRVGQKYGSKKKPEEIKTEDPSKSSLIGQTVKRSLFVGLMKPSDLEKLGIENNYKKLPLNRQVNAMIKDGIRQGLIKESREYNEESGMYENYITFLEKKSTNSEKEHKEQKIAQAIKNIKTQYKEEDYHILQKLYENYVNNPKGEPRIVNAMKERLIELRDKKREKGEQ